MTASVLILGNSTDFIDESTNIGPDWEHIVMLREPGVAKLALDGLATSPGAFMPGRRYIDAGLIYRLGKALGQGHVLLAQSEQSGYQALLALTVSFPRRPLFIFFHGGGWWTKRNRAFAKLAAWMPSVRFLCLSAALRDVVVQEYGIDPARVYVTGFGVDGQYFKPDPTVTPDRIVSAGTASRDYRTLVESSRLLDARVCIAADSTWHRERLNVADEQVPENVEISSAGDYVQLRTLYSKALFVVVPLLDVRFACGYAVMAEAMAMGKAVIATRTGCPSDLIVDGVSGIYVPPGDVAAMRAAMQRLLSDSALAVKMGQEGRRLIEERFSLNAYVGRVREVIEQALLPAGSVQ